MKNKLENLLSAMIWAEWCVVASFSILFAILISFMLPKKIHNKLAQYAATAILYSAFIFPKVKWMGKGAMPFPVIYTPNHVSFFDLFVCATLLPGYPRGLQLQEHFSKPFYGWVITRFGQIPIDLSSRGSIKHSFDKVADILKNRERNILILPEGQRTETGKIGPFKSGAFYLSKKTGVPVVPVVFKKLFERNNKTSFVINPGFFDAVIMEPVYPEGFVNEDEMAKHVKMIMEQELEK